MEYGLLADFAAVPAGLDRLLHIADLRFGHGSHICISPTLPFQPQTNEASSTDWRSVAPFLDEAVTADWTSNLRGLSSSLAIALKLAGLYIFRTFE
jgi:hypothetical protein